MLLKIAIVVALCTVSHVASRGRKLGHQIGQGNPFGGMNGMMHPDQMEMLSDMMEYQQERVKMAREMKLLRNMGIDMGNFNPFDFGNSGNPMAPEGNHLTPDQKMSSPQFPPKRGGNRKSAARAHRKPEVFDNINPGEYPKEQHAHADFPGETNHVLNNNQAGDVVMDRMQVADQATGRKSNHRRQKNEGATKAKVQTDVPKKNVNRQADAQTATEQKPVATTAATTNRRRTSRRRQKSQGQENKVNPADINQHPVGGKKNSPKQQNEPSGTLPNNPVNNDPFSMQGEAPKEPAVHPSAQGHLPSDPSAQSGTCHVEYAQAFRYFELCSDTDTEFRVSCSKTKCCKHNMICVMNRCCARSSDHNDQLDRILDQKEQAAKMARMSKMFQAMKNQQAGGHNPFPFF